MVLLTKDLYFKYFKRVPVEKSVSAWSSSCPGFPVFPPEVTLSLSRDRFDALGLRRWSLGWCFETFWMELLLVLSKATSKHPDASRIQQFLLAFIISILEIWEVFRLQFPKRPAIYNAPQDTVTEAWLHDINDFSCSHILCICILYRASLDSSVHSWFSRDSAESHHVQEVRGDDMKDVQELPLEEVMFVCKAGQKPWIFVNPSLDNIAPTYQICGKEIILHLFSFPLTIVDLMNASIQFGADYGGMYSRRSLWKQAFCLYLFTVSLRQSVRMPTSAACPYCLLFWFLCTLTLTEILTIFCQHAIKIQREGFGWHSWHILDSLHGLHPSLETLEVFAVDLVDRKGSSFGPATSWGRIYRIYRL